MEWDAFIKSQFCEFGAGFALQDLCVFFQDFCGNAQSIPSVEQREPQIVVTASTGYALKEAVRVED